MTRAGIAALFAFGLWACGGGDEHPSAAVNGSVADSRASLADACNPGEERACHRFYTDSRGQLHCPAGTQTCNEDGTGWTECGPFGALTPGRN